MVKREAYNTYTLRIEYDLGNNEIPLHFEAFEIDNVMITRRNNMLAKKGNVSYPALMMLLGILAFVTYRAYTGQQPHEVILIAGTSSAGKTSIINELMKRVGDNYKVVSIDDFDAEGNIQKVLEQKAKEWGWDDAKSSLNDFMDSHVLKQTGAYDGIDTVLSTAPTHAIQKEITDATYSAFFEYAKKKAYKSNIVIDTVYDSLDTYNQFTTIFRDHKTIKILVYCPLNTIQERVEKRNLTGKPEEQRTLFQVYPQFAAFYKVQDSPLDQVVDIVSSEQILQPLNQVIDDLIKQLEQTKLENDVMKTKFKVVLESVHTFKAEFVKRFRLRELKEVVLTAINHYDLILNSRTQDFAKNAQEIAHYLKAKIKAD